MVVGLALSRKCRGCWQLAMYVRWTRLYEGMGVVGGIESTRNCKYQGQNRKHERARAARQWHGVAVQVSESRERA
jgi:hypothetical protein